MVKRLLEVVSRIVGTVTRPSALHRAPRRHWALGSTMPLRQWEMPETPQELEMVYAMWDARNGRYWLRADVVLEGGTFLRDVVFDGDSRVAVRAAGRHLSEFSDCFGKRIIDFFTVEDYSPGRDPPFRADDQRRAAFAARHGAPSRPSQCDRCGYDLRATPGRCPECGTAAAAEAAAAAAAPPAAPPA